MTQPSRSLPSLFPVAAAPWMALACVAAWVLFGGALDQAQHGDNFEQFNWAHSLEWGYHKHPPLPTWLLGLWQRVWGESPSATLFVAGLCGLATGACTWLIGRALMGPRLAGIAVLLWGLHHAYSWKAQVLNHNTVMMTCIAACAFAAITALRTQGRASTLAWVGVGLAGGLALLAKYQSAIALAGILLALGHGGAWRQRRHVVGTVGAVLLALGLFAPHLVWLVQHDFITLKYASQSAQNLDLGDRLWRITVFLLLQARVMVALLACAGLWWLWQRLAQAGPLPADEVVVDTAVPRRSWLFGLVVFPLGTVLLVCLLGGVKLQDHWGFQPLQFISLLLAWQLRGVAAGGLGRLALLALVAHGALAATWSRPVWSAHSSQHASRTNQYFFPAQPLTDAVMADWRAVTSCPLRYVVGPPFEAGIVSVYSRTGAVVFENGAPAKSPWVDPVALASAGAVVIERDVPPAAPGAVKRGQADPARRGEVTHWAIVPPQRPCPP
ncbi:MAG: hypothetical protein RLZZ618_1947 [Pseudomonadota bacterium]|jgi:4-amino-4-deoxy-L-arabinose transferase-like glycosyltransferase